MTVVRQEREGGLCVLVRANSRPATESVAQRGDQARGGGGERARMVAANTKAPTRRGGGGEHINPLVDRETQGINILVQEQLTCVVLHEVNSFVLIIAVRALRRATGFLCALLLGAVVEARPTPSDIGCDYKYCPGFLFSGWFKS